MEQEKNKPFEGREMGEKMLDAISGIAEGWAPLFQLSARIKNMKESDLEKLTENDFTRIKDLVGKFDKKEEVERALDEIEGILSSVEEK